MFAKRSPLRLKNYDYASNGAYFVTICTKDRECLFGEITERKMRLNEFGEIVRDEWLKTPVVRPGVELDVFVVMPNHIHGIVVLSNKEIGSKAVTNRKGCGPASSSVGAMIGQFKSATTKRIRAMNRRSGLIWQRDYYDHIIRDESDLNKIREYIIQNPMRWMEDENHPMNLAHRSMNAGRPTGSPLLTRTC